MDNAGVVASYLDEYGLLESLRNQEETNTLYTRKDINAEPEQEKETDVVELSTESLQLSQTNENPQELEINPTRVEEPLPPPPVTRENENLIQRLNNIIGDFEAAIEVETTETSETTIATTPSTLSETELEVGVENLTEETPTETGVPLEVQANRISQIDQIIAYANGLPAESITDVERAIEPTQYQEQLLLQTIGTQLAQVALPSKVISFVG